MSHKENSIQKIIISTRKIANTMAMVVIVLLFVGLFGSNIYSRKTNVIIELNLPMKKWGKALLGKIENVVSEGCFVIYFLSLILMTIGSGLLQTLLNRQHG